MKKKDLLIPVAMLALGAGIGFWTRPNGDERAAPNTSSPSSAKSTEVGASQAEATQTHDVRSTELDATEEITAPAVTTATQDSSNPAPASAALPPMDLPATDTYALLHDRAVGGDVVAACRLAFELQRCDRLTPDFDAEMIDASDPARAKDPASLARMEKRLAAIADRQSVTQRCDGLSETQRREGYDRLRQAALAGHLPSLLAYANDGGIPEQYTLQRLDQLRRYREEAIPLLERAVLQGSAAAAEQLSMVHLPQFGMSRLGGLMPGEPDRVAGAALMLYTIQLMRIQPSDFPDPVPTPEEIRQLLRVQLGISDAEMVEAQRQSDARLAALKRPIDAHHYTGEMIVSRYAGMFDEAPKARPINDVCAQGPWIDLGGLATGGAR